MFNSTFDNCCQMMFVSFTKCLIALLTTVARWCSCRLLVR